MIYTVRTIVGRENMVVDAISARAKTHGIKILSVFHPEEIKGYVFVEGDIREVEKAVQNIPNVRGLLRRPISVEEMRRFLEPRKAEVKLNVGDLVEVIGGPFKGEKGKVKRFDEVKREVTIELIEAVVPIPITVPAEFVKIVEKKGEKSE